MITTELPKRLLPQKCPLCNEPQDIIVNGHFDNGKGEQIAELDKGYSFCNCHNIFYTNPNNLQDVYNADYFKRYDNPLSSKCYERYYLDYGATIKDELGIKNGAILDIGCINPTLLNCFKKDGFITYGNDIFNHNLNGHRQLIGNFETIEINEKFDIIWASHIFEHFLKPIEAIKKCYDLLNNKGVLFVAMPDPFIIDWTAPYRWGHWCIREHHILWNMEDFCQELEKAGFRIVFKKRNFEYKFICIGDYHLLAQKVVLEV